jgi:hypothetical protein
MTHYSSRASQVKVEMYRLSGKWYMDETIDMNEFYHELSVRDAVVKALHKSHPDTAERWLDQFIIVASEPYHKNGHPQMIYPQWMFEIVQAEDDRRLKIKLDARLHESHRQLGADADCNRCRAEHANAVDGMDG